MRAANAEIETRARGELGLAEPSDAQMKIIVEPGQ
jgi:hypothetical protein